MTGAEQVSVGTLSDILESHTPEWDYDISYDEPVRCSCGWRNDEEPITLHVATILHAIMRHGSLSDLIWTSRDGGFEVYRDNVAEAAGEPSFTLFHHGEWVGAYQYTQQARKDAVPQDCSKCGAS